MRKHAWVVIAFLAVVSTGCTTMESSAEYSAYRKAMDTAPHGGYFWMTCKDLALDFTDILSAGVSFGPGLLIDIQPTKVLEIGAGYADVATIGWRHRASGFYREIRKEGGISGLYYRHMDLEPIYGTPQLFNKNERPRAMRDFTIRHNNDRHWLDIGLNFQLVAFGADVYFSPEETADFLVDVVAFPYNALLRPLFNSWGFRPPEIDIDNDDTTAIAREKAELTVVKPETGFPPAELIDQLFRTGYSYSIAIMNQPRLPQKVAAADSFSSIRHFNPPTPEPRTPNHERLHHHTDATLKCEDAPALLRWSASR